MRTRLFLLTMALFMSGCGIDASLIDLNPVIEKIVPEKPRTFPDTVAGEVVTSNGYEVRAVLGELTENQVSGGYKIEGVFAENLQ
ncbi:MAG: hypothetical protein KF802_03735 [Bdellovibrionaceae bacterium]|nr:hypothetical protein [Pseudobdellovibrionaceae bacterium]MBX3033266.1 hypothetical protein [Pseudobdellovibrionaceae bacterium]